MGKKLIIANWKALPATPAEAEALAGAIQQHIVALGESAPELVICPPFIFIEEVAKLVGEAVLGAQDIAARDEGAQTGEVSGPQLVKLGVQYVIIGHSERRWKIGESDEMVSAKLQAALRAGLLPIVCLGERTREGEWRDELASQTISTFRGLTPGQISQCLVAYEPVWAISTNPDAKPDTPASAVQSMSLIRETLTDHFDVSKPTFLYGGSVTPTNAEDFLARSEISGVLVGGASVKGDQFAEILTIASRIL